MSASLPLNLRSPHSILAALQMRPKDVLSVRLPESDSAGVAWEQVAELVQQHRIPQPRTAPVMGRGGDRRPAGEATVRERQPGSWSDLLAECGGSDRPGLWIALDQVQDPQNVGAIFRTAAFFGVRGILLCEDRAAPLSGTAYDVASGGLEAVPFARETNLRRALEDAKKAGLWIIGSSEHAKGSYRKQSADRPWLLVLGNEEKGIRRLTQDVCDVIVSIPQAGEVDSLNVSVAAGILISQLAPEKKR